MSKDYEVLNLENEQRYISYLLRNPKESTAIPSQYFINSVLRIVCESIQDLVLNEGLDIINIDDVIIKCKDRNVDVTYKQLQDIKDSFISFDNIEFLRKTLKANHLKHIINSQLLEDMLVKTTSIGDPDAEMEEIGKLAEKILQVKGELEDADLLLDTKTLANNHREVMRKRKEGVRIRTFGFSKLDAKITKPASAGEITSLVGMTGSGKSAFCKNIENKLINKGVPVISLNPEMETESSIDRLLCLRRNFYLDDLVKKDKSIRLEMAIEKSLQDLESIDNYYYCEEPDMNLDKADYLIHQAKKQFRELGLLDEDEYVFVTYDLLDMFEEFENADPYKLKKNLNKLHKITRKHKCHSLIVLQANENKLRGGKVFKKSKDLDYYKVGLEDIWGGSAYAKASRLVMTIHRPRLMKLRFFPEEEAEWKDELDFINIHGVKQNDGDLFFVRYTFKENFRIEYFSGKMPEV